MIATPPFSLAFLFSNFSWSYVLTLFWLALEISEILVDYDGLAREERESLIMGIPVPYYDMQHKNIIHSINDYVLSDIELYGPIA